MKENLLALSLLFFSCVASAEVVSEIKCFDSNDNKPIRFELRTYFDTSSKWQGGYVKYQSSKALIPLVLQHIEEEVIEKNRPYQVTTTWFELNNGKVTGKYEFISQGAIVYSATYTNYIKNKKYFFRFDTQTETSGLNGCEWQ